MIENSVKEFYGMDSELKFLAGKIDTSDIDEKLKTSLYIGTLIRLLQNNLTYNMNDNLKALNLTSSQFEIIIFLIANEDREVNQKDIEHKFNLKNPTVTGLLKRLEAKGFINRYASEHDGRYKKIVLTEKSRQIADNMYDSVRIYSESFFKGISEEEKKEFIKVLIKINKNIEELNNKIK